MKTSRVHFHAAAAFLFSALAMGCGGADAPSDLALNDSGMAEDVAIAAEDVAIAIDVLPEQPETDHRDSAVIDAIAALAETPTQVDAIAYDTLAAHPSQGKATIVVLPDTQYYAASFHDVFSSQTTWIATQKPLLNIAAVLHVGDIVDTDNAPQWSVAKDAMNRLDKANVPYVVVPGNHDYRDLNRTTTMDTYFGPASMPWIKGTMVAGQIENSFTLVDIGPQKWLVLGLEFGPRDAVIAWANDVLTTYPDLPTIIVTHAYLDHNGHRYDIKVSGPDSSKPNYQPWIPQYYGYTAGQGINDGEQIWQKLVLPHKNVRMVFSGHDTGSARLTSARPDGSVVYQMLSDYQWYRTDAPDYDGGGGYLRVLEFDYDNKQVNVRTYSPHLKQYLTDDQNQFTLDLTSP